MAMPLSMVAPELRKATRRMGVPIPIGSRLGRHILRRLMTFVRTPKQDAVAVETIAGTPPIRVYTPHDRRSDAALLWIHGGGYVIGSALMDDRFCIDTARELGIVVASVDYRLAPEHPFPASLDDCLAAWRWLQCDAASRGVDPARVGIGGQSAGGGLAAALVQRVHDAGGVQPIAQWLFCPMLDDRTAADRSLNAIGHRVWSNGSNAIGWRCYLGREPGGDGGARYAAAGRRTDLSGLPPAWIGVGSIDLFRAEDAAYADRLDAAGVPVRLDQVAGAPHGFEAWASKSDMARRFVAGARGWLGEALAASSSSRT